MERKGLNSKGIDYTSRFVEKKYKLIISEKSLENVSRARDLLEHDNSLSFLLYGNHTTLDDPLYLGYVLNQIDPEGTRQVIAPMSYSHTNEEHPIKNSATIWMKNTVEECNVKTYPVIQTYQIGNKYSAAEAYSINKIMFRDLRNFHKNRNSVGILIFPEGHRSENGTLIKAEKGIVQIAQESLPILLIPVGIDYKGKSSRNLLNFNRQLEVVVGEPLLVRNIDDSENMFEEIMGRLAMVLPENKRGEYSYLAQIPEIRK